MRRFFVEIEEDALDTLREWAVCERRSVRDQAALILEQALADERNPAVRAAQDALAKERRETATGGERKAQLCPA